MRSYMDTGFWSNNHEVMRNAVQLVDGIVMDGDLEKAVTQLDEMYGATLVDVRDIAATLQTVVKARITSALKAA
ncbi:MAG: hypothetical protein WAZ18_03190 [Alphaproteobacteria bacterium]